MALQLDLQCGAVWCSLLQCVAGCCSVLQYAAVCCIVLKCAAAGYSVLQCVDMSGYVYRGWKMVCATVAVC